MARFKSAMGVPHHLTTTSGILVKSRCPTFPLNGLIRLMFAILSI